MFELRARVRRGFARVLPGLLLVVMAVASLAGGSFYRWCIPLERAMDACCCDHDEPVEQPSVQRVCCEERAIGALPAAQPGGGEVVAPAAAAVAPDESEWIPPLPPFISRTLRVAAGPRAPPLARPPPRQRLLALIQVYRC